MSTDTDTDTDTDAIAWIDTHCHLDAPEFDADRAGVVMRARAAGVASMVLPAVRAADFEQVRDLARQHELAYALGIHPLCSSHATAEDLARMGRCLQAWRDDPRLVAVGEIGLDFFAPGLDRARQVALYEAQLALAREAGLPVLLHVRRSADALLHGLRRLGGHGGIVHAFNGSEVQALGLIRLGMRLGFGGAMTYERALQIRHLAASVPAHVPVLETDAPDIPPRWLYRTAAQRARGQGQGRNEPSELPRIGATLAALRGQGLRETAAQTVVNALEALPRLAAVWGAADRDAPRVRAAGHEG